MPQLHGELATIRTDFKISQETIDSPKANLIDDDGQSTNHELSTCKAELQSSKAELKIFKECVESQGQRVTEAEARMADEKHQREAVEAHGFHPLHSLGCPGSRCGV